MIDYIYVETCARKIIDNLSEGTECTTSTLSSVYLFNFHYASSQNGEAMSLGLGEAQDEPVEDLRTFFSQHQMV